MAAGDLGAFHDLYRSTSARLLGVCLRILGERGEAEEALQEAYLSIWRRAASFDPGRGPAGAWLVTVARNCAVDRLRARGRIASVPLALADDVPDEAPLASELVGQRHEQARLAACLGLLGTGDMGLIEAAFFQGSTYRELAVRTGRPLATVKSRVRRALARLAECLR